MLLNYLCIRLSVNDKFHLRYTDLWQDVLLVMYQDKELCRKFSLHDWQEALLCLKGENLVSADYEDYLKRLLI